MNQLDKERNKFRAGFVAASTAVLSLMAIGTVAYHYLEGWSWTSSLYFTVVTMSTVGYGDLHPTNDGTRLFTIFFILFGVTIAVSSITYLGGQYLSKRELSVEQRRQNRDSKKGKK